MNGTGWTDNVLREHQFLDRHPEIIIVRPIWAAGAVRPPEWVATGGILADPVRDPELGGLLDKLELIFGEHPTIEP